MAEQQRMRRLIGESTSKVIEMADDWRKGQAGLSYEQYRYGKELHFSVVRGNKFIAAFPSPEADPLRWSSFGGPLLTVYPANKDHRSTMLLLGHGQTKAAGPADFSPGHGGLSSIKYDFGYHPKDRRQVIEVDMIQNHYVHIPENVPELKKDAEGHLIFGLGMLVAKAQYLGLDLFIRKEAIRGRESVVRKIMTLGKQLKTPVWESPEGITVVKPSEKRMKLWEGMFEKTKGKRSN
ncbi:MAG: hypothetical protein ABIG96_02490 [Candidatus Micrarchaeota archaeon]